MTVKFTVITVSIELVLGLIIALVVNSGFKGRGVMRAVMLVPWAIPTVVAAQMWKWMYDDVFGVVNDSFVRLNIIDRPVAWISEQPLAAVAAVDIWKTTPFVALLLLAGLQVIPHELYEAADVDGASKWHQFWRITLPLLVPAILVTLIFRTLDALRVFDVFYVFFGSRVDTQTMAIYNQNTIVAFGDVGYGAAISVGHLPDHRPLRRHLHDVHAGAAAMSVVAERAERAQALVKRKRRERRGLQRLVRRIPFYLLIAAIFVYALFPFYWALRSAFIAESDLFRTPVQYIPRNPTLVNFRDVLSSDQFLRALLNSTIVAGAVTLIALALGSLAGYALGRFRFRGRSTTLYVMLSMTIFPQIAILGALYTMINRFDLYDSLRALILSYMILVIPFTVWVLTSFMRALPKDLEEAAYVDGASPLQTFYRVMLPLVAPGLVTAGLLAFIAAWNEFLFALSFTQSPEKYTVPVAITSFTGESAFDKPWGQIMAATVIVTVPLIVLTLVLQRRILAGLTAGAVKG